MQDFTILVSSIRRDGKSLGQMAKEEVNPVAGLAAMVAILAIMIILLAVLALVVVNALRGSPWGLFTIATTIPIAFLMGWWMKHVRPGKVVETSLIGVVLLMLGLVGGQWVSQHPVWAAAFTWSGTQICWAIIVYGFIASVLPVWMLLAPRDYLSTFLKVGTLLILAGAIIIMAPPLKMPAVTQFAAGTGPVFAGKLFPFAFITIACGAISGFHALIASGTTPKMVMRETDAVLVGYGAMLTESFVGLMAMIAAAILEPGVYFAMNVGPGALGTTAESAARKIAEWGFMVTPEQLTGAGGADGRDDAAVAHRRRAEPRGRHGERARQRLHRAGHGALVPLRDPVRSALHPDDRSTRARASGASCSRSSPATCGSRSARLSWYPSILLSSAVVVAGWGYFIVSGRDRSARRHQLALAAVRDREPAARGHRAVREHDHHHQDGEAPLLVGDARPAGVAGRRRR